MFRSTHDSLRLDSWPARDIYVGGMPPARSTRNLSRAAADRSALLQPLAARKSRKRR